MMEPAKSIRKIMWEIDLPHVDGLAETHLDLGAGGFPRNPFNAKRLISCDVIEPSRFSSNCEYVKCDLTSTLPFDSNSFTSISAYDVLEHIPRWERRDGEIIFPFINLMNEIFRILTPGGIFYAVTPMYPSHSAFVDPTHINFMTLETVNYFANAGHARNLGYGFEENFELVFSGWLKGAGPWEHGVSLQSQTRFEPWSKLKITAYLKIIKRIILRMLNRKPTHVLWVIRKPQPS